MKNQIGSLFAFALPAMLSLQSPAALAQEEHLPDGKPSAGATVSKADTWRVRAGTGLVLRPTFEGSDRYTLFPVPMVSATYNDMISIGIRGLNVYWHRGSLKLGAGLTYHGGRKERKSGSFFNRGDDRLMGLGNIRSALGVHAFGSWKVARITLSGKVTRYTGSDNRGALVNLGTSLPYKASDRLILRSHLNVTWADNRFMQTFFGVTGAQAAGSMFAPFNARAGVKDVSVGVNANYRLDRHWFLSVNGGIKRLLGDAARSPISIADTQLSLLAMAGYRF